jgi:hypothetical protein
MIDKTKTYRTRDGREVRIYAVDGSIEYPVHGAVSVDGQWECLVWRMDGRLGGYIGTETDLIEVKPRIKREVWVNVYPTHVSVTYEEKADADNAAYQLVNRRIACVKLTIDCEEGEGL